MLIENRLQELGFTKFIHLDKNRRDSLLRLTWSGIYKESILTVLIVKNEDKWIIDKILFNHKDSILEKLLKDSDVNKLIKFIEGII